MKRQYTAVAALCFLLVSSFAFLGCEVGSSDSAVRNMSVNFSGLYDAKGDGTAFIAPANSGAPVTSLNLRQNGDQLEAIDNNNIVFGGTLNDSSGDSGSATAGFTLEGHTTAGNAVTVSGSLSGSGSSAEMRATWIEPDRYCNLVGDATINAIQTNTPSSVSLIASTTTLNVGDTVTLTASGASSYDWAKSGTAGGTFENTSSGTDGNNKWTATSTGSATLTATDHSDGSRSASVTITVN